MQAPSPSPSPFSARGSNEPQHPGHAQNSAKTEPKRSLSVRERGHGGAESHQSYHVQPSGLWAFDLQQGTLCNLEAEHVPRVAHDTASSLEGVESDISELILTKVDWSNHPEEISAWQGQNAQERHVNLDCQGSPNDTLQFGTIWDQNPTAVACGQNEFTHARDQQGIFNHAPDAGRVTTSGYPQSTEFSQGGMPQGAIGTLDNPFEESSVANKGEAGVDGFKGFSMRSNAGSIPQTEADILDISINNPGAPYVAQEEMATLGNPHGYSYDVSLLDDALDNALGYPYDMQLGGNMSGLVDPFQQSFSTAQYGTMAGSYLQDNMNLSAPMPQLAQPAILGKPRTGCTWYGCNESFVRHTDLGRHVQAVHYGIKHHCSWPGCANNRGKGYCRLEKLRTHQKEKHGYALV